MILLDTDNIPFNIHHKYLIKRSYIIIHSHDDGVPKRIVCGKNEYLEGELINNSVGRRWRFLRNDLEDDIYGPLEYFLL